MKLEEYFATVKGIGILSTADDKGIVNAAVYATPHCMEDDLVCFIMREHKTHENIAINPYACYSFIEGGKMDGKRIYLTKVKEEKNSELLFSIRRRYKHDGCETSEDLYLVFFKVDRVLPLVGSGEI